MQKLKIIGKPLRGEKYVSSCYAPGNVDFGGEGGGPPLFFVLKKKRKKKTERRKNDVKFSGHYDRPCTLNVRAHGLVHTKNPNIKLN